jgi:hypothetical protein
MIVSFSLTPNKWWQGVEFYPSNMSILKHNHQALSHKYILCFNYTMPMLHMICFIYCMSDVSYVA